jgi:hypothetical protein
LLEATSKSKREVNMSSEVHAAGQCLCGAVRIAVKGTPVRMAQCHCKDCQRVTGTGHASNAIFRAEDVTITGETKGCTVTADSGNASTRHFCPACGARMYGTNTGRPGMVVVPVGVFDDTSWFKPEAVLYTRRRPVWDITTDSVPNFAAMPPTPASAQR